MNFVNFWCRRLVLLSVVVFGMVACSGSDPAPGGGVGAAGTLSGTAATGAAIAGTEISIKSANGSIKITSTLADGTYTLDVNTSTFPPPYLLKVADPTKANSFLFSVATASGTANIHPFTDLIVRNWYKVQSTDVETQFNGQLDPTKLPTVVGINTIEAVVSDILVTSLANAGLPADFNLLTSTFAANLVGFDKVLEDTKVVVAGTGVVTIVATDPVSGTSSTLVTTSTSPNLAALPVDTAVPSDPAGLVALPAVNSIVLFWNASTDNVGVAGYNIYSGAIKIATSPFPGFSHTGLTAIQHCYQIEAFDLAGKVSSKTLEVCATPLTAADTAAPAAPTSLLATASLSSPSQIDLTWVASTSQDTVGYDIYRGGTFIATTNGTSYSNTGLASSTSYSYTVKARDAAGNPSVASISASATTAAGTPSPPTGVAAVAGNQQVTISWNPVSGATSYKMYMDTVSGISKTTVTAGVMHHPSVTSPFVHTALTNGTTYFFVITAVNDLGESISSAQVQATPTSGTINAIVGSWSNVTGGWGPPGTDLEFTFFANGDYIQAQSVADGSPFVQPGLEHGTYTWNSATGAFTAACPTVDTNLQAGFSTPNGVQCTAGTTVMSTTVTVIGNTMTIIDNSSVPPATITLSRVVDANNAIVGSWAFPGNTSVELTFFANGDYMQAQSVANNIPFEQPGLEHGTYTWNSATGAFTAACPTVDTNLQAGFSHPAVTGVGCTAGTTVMSTTVTVNGNTMTLIDNSVSPPETITLSRVN